MLPDLRWSGALHSADAFDRVVGKGALTAYGMDAFQQAMSAEEIESVRQFLLKRANATYDREMKARDNPSGIPDNTGPVFK